MPNILKKDTYLLLLVPFFIDTHNIYLCIVVVVGPKNKKSRQMAKCRHLKIFQRYYFYMYTFCCCCFCSASYYKYPSFENHDLPCFCKIAIILT